MLDTLYGKAVLAVTVMVAVFVFLKGGEAERLAMGGYLLAWLASVLVQDDGRLFQDFQWKLFLIDIAVSAFFGFIVWRYARTWAVWATALQLLTVMSHIVYLIDVRPSVAAFYTVLNLVSYGIILSIAVGTFWAWQERRAAGLE
ncbi:hypothetical protein BZG35_07720 [Brevundimonas sp. LM2]|uniref:hypothetical protein n=1 Tax=Brevundimonas sp. LM2 TaxID=1938605 RepID=UPI000983FAB3|nr:hypothetical protein [Brevundimonas sp. LM2]AQR61553.1 hypothetical protein BZG35_07720 [Brevundimonas sp. LM2]